MATTDENLLFSQLAYDETPPETPAPGWTKIAQSPKKPGMQGSENGYFGVAFQNERTGEIVIANRGSRATAEGLKQDWATTDVQIGAQGGLGIPRSFADGQDFATQVQTENPGVPISFTGHSLGGAHAQHQAGNLGGRFETFGAPGAAFSMSEAKVKAAANNGVNHVLPGDLIGRSGEHVGQVSMTEPTGKTALLNKVALGVGVVVGGILGLLVGALGAIATSHPLGNYKDALGSTGAAAGGGGGGRPAARLTDMHVCPMFTGLVPHVGGPVFGPGAPTVIVGAMPAARVGDMLICVGPPDVIMIGSTTVLINGRPAARIADTTVHGGSLVSGFPTVLIGG